MPLWDNFARQAEALPLAAPHGADDFIAIHDASASAAQKIAVRNLRSKELFSVPMYQASTAAVAANVIVNAPLRVIRCPYAFTLTMIVVSAVTAPSATYSFDVMSNRIGIFTGGTALSSPIQLATSALRAEYTSFNGQPTFSIAENDELRFYVTAGATTNAVRMPNIHLLGYRT